MSVANVHLDETLRSSSFSGARPRRLELASSRTRHSGSGLPRQALGCPRRRQLSEGNEALCITQSKV